MFFDNILYLRQEKWGKVDLLFRIEWYKYVLVNRLFESSKHSFDKFLF